MRHCLLLCSNFLANTEAALRNVSMVFRSHPEWTVTEPVRNIGKIPCSCDVVGVVFGVSVCHLEG